MHVQVKEEDEAEIAAQRRPPRHDPRDPVVMERPPACNPSRIDPRELESLMLNLDAALRVRVRHQFFNWTQGALQSLVGHELLVCAMRDGASALFHVDSFSTAPVEAPHFNDLFRQDVALVPCIIKNWEANYCKPVICDLNGEGRFAGSALARELVRLGANEIIAHGTHDAAGQLASFFIFACRSGATGPKQAGFVELLVPFVHSAWVRSQVNWQGRGAGARHAATHLLTSREREILEWIYRGKSNIEVGMILTISPLTVKNHVQKILRKLSVMNRTQAVGKALALRIINT